MSRVLIICSNFDHAEIPVVVCHDAKLTCAFATEPGAEATLAEELPDVVLLAVADPLPLARRLHAASPRTPLLAITGALAEGEQRALRAAGVSTIVFKPYSIQALRKALERAVRAAQDGHGARNRAAL